MGFGARGQLLSLREAYIYNLSLLPSLEALEKFVVVGGGWVGGWVVVETKFSVKLEPKLNNWYSQPYQNFAHFANSCLILP